MADAGVDANLRGREWRRFLRGPDQQLLDELYVPALSAAVRYDRCCGYFSSTVLAAAARGFGRLIERLETMGDAAPKPAVRLVVNEELNEDDVRALTETGDLSRLEQSLLERLTPVEDLLVRERLEVLAWLAARDLLEVKVGIMRRGVGIVHAKFGTMIDAAGDAVVFSGSDNETAQGLRANYERLEVSTSWDDPERFEEYRTEFESLWADKHPDVHTVRLPEAVRLKLISLAKPSASTTEPAHALARQRAAMLWRFIVEAPYLPDGGPTCDASLFVALWPHQKNVVTETTASWPEGRLLCDEVGMGKTIEAMCVLRRLLAGRGVGRALLLLPAGLVRQWQAELREKGGMIFPRLEGANTIVWADGSSEKVKGLAEALTHDVLLMSRETARTDANQRALLDAQPWDLVLLDEAHAARRKDQVENEYNSATLLLGLLRNLQLNRKAKSIILLSATPMQTHPWEPWDLLAVLGEGGPWLAEFRAVRDFYHAIASVRNGRCDPQIANSAAALVAQDPLFPHPMDSVANLSAADLARKLRFPPSSDREALSQWLRQGAPLGRRMHRNTRDTLRRYHQMGLIDAPPATRDVDDLTFDYEDQAERDLYNSITKYIEKRFQELEHEKPGKGFVMTIYRRRASSSPYALERSLSRRLEGLVRASQQQAVDASLWAEDAPDALEMDELPDDDTGKVSAALPTDPYAAKAERIEVEDLLERLRDLHGRDTKRDRFYDVLRQITDDGRAVLVFTEYTDTMEYLAGSLLPVYTKELACYSGEGGRVWDGQDWQLLTKNVITDRLRRGELKVLVCTDAASEGLNLQAAGALINYDLPWNPSKVEQRIGRIDRIGQKYPIVRIVNLFLKDSIDDQVYRVLRARCGLFEHFVGAMQPVLAQARLMLMGHGLADLHGLNSAADNIDQDPLAEAAYGERSAEDHVPSAPSVSAAHLRLALEQLTGDFGPNAVCDWDQGVVKLRGLGASTIVYGTTLGALESDSSYQPLTPFEPRLRMLPDILEHPGEHLPLVVAAASRNGFRVGMAYWVGDDEVTPMGSFDEVLQRAQSWDGHYPDPERWQAALAQAHTEASTLVDEMSYRADNAAEDGLARQIQAATLRLKLELGRYLMCLGGTTSDLNSFWHQQMQRDMAVAPRLRQALNRLAGYPAWEPDICRELSEFIADLPENRRKARLAGSELDAALNDPRWAALVNQDLPSCQESE